MVSPVVLVHKVQRRAPVAGSALFTRRWPDGTPRFDRVGEPVRKKWQRASAKFLDIQLCRYYGIAPNVALTGQQKPEKGTEL